MLTLVAEQPGHGYDVGTRFLQRYGTRFGQRRASIYDALDRLEQRGLVEALGDDAREPVRYRATGAGMDEAASWLASVEGVPSRGRRASVSIEDMAEDVLARIGATPVDDIEGRSALLDLYEEFVTASLKEPVPAQRGSFAGWAAEWRRTRVSAKLEWVFWARADLRKRAASS